MNTISGAKVDATSPSRTKRTGKTSFSERDEDVASTMNSRQLREKLNEKYQLQMDAAYLACRERERVAEAKRRLYTKQGRFDAAMVRMDTYQAGDKFRGASTLGTVVADSDKRLSLAARNKQKLDHACEKLCRHGYGYLVRVLRLIAKNGNNRMESICELMNDATCRQKPSTTSTAKNSADYSGLKRAKKGAD